jgi:hypothetical protein
MDCVCTPFKVGDQQSSNSGILEPAPHIGVNSIFSVWRLFSGTLENRLNSWMNEKIRLAVSCLLKGNPLHIQFLVVFLPDDSLPPGTHICRAG